MESTHFVLTDWSSNNVQTTEIPFSYQNLVLGENLNSQVGIQLGAVVDMSSIKNTSDNIDLVSKEYYDADEQYLLNLDLELKKSFNITKFKELYLAKLSSDLYLEPGKKREFQSAFFLSYDHEILNYFTQSENNQSEMQLIFYWACKHSPKASVEKIITKHPWLVDREFKIEIAKDIFVKDENKKFILNLPPCEFKTAFDQLFKDIKEELTKALAHITAINLLKPQKDPKIGYLDNIDKSLSFSNYAYSGVIKYTKDQLRAIIDSEKNTKKPKSNILIFAEVLMMATIVLYAVYLLINKLFPKKSHVEKVCEKHINNLSIFANKYSEDIKLSVPQKSYR